MKQDILIFSNRIDLTGAANTSLAEHDISAIIASDMRTTLSVLQTRTPAFLWLDLDTDAARSFLSEIMDRHLNPPPYIILTSSFSNSADRAGMLNQGADACVELPVDLREILAILNAVLRREEIGRASCRERV